MRTMTRVVRSSQEAYSYLYPMAYLEQEAVWVLYLDSGYGVLRVQEIFRGTLREAPLEPREILKGALFFNAAALIVAHNHPSGRANPSKSDCDATLRLQQAAALFGIEIVDHLILGRYGTFTSLKSEGLMETAI